jgi:predicted unusual protein kinase regulating ubiquinone biosynthesis (AarF/ABC1/UbiB family)
MSFFFLTFIFHIKIIINIHINMESIIKTLYTMVAYRNIFASKVLQLWASYLTNINLEENDIVSYNQSEIDYDAINECKNLGYIFENNSPRSTGVVATVFFAYKILNDNTKKWAAIKIKKKGIEEKIKTSIYYIDLISRFMPDYVLCLYNELKHSVQIQTNLELEANELMIWKEKMKNNNSIHIPDVYDHTKNWIAMELIDGLTLRDIIDFASESFIIESAKRCIKFSTDCVINGIYHGDLHVGNIMFSKNYVHIYDVGITYHFNEYKSKKIALIYCRFIELILTGDYTILDEDEIGEIVELFVIDNQHTKKELGKLCIELMIKVSKSCNNLENLYNVSMSDQLNIMVKNITDKLHLTNEARQIMLVWTMQSGLLSVLANNRENKLSKYIADEYSILVDYCFD